MKIINQLIARTFSIILAYWITNDLATEMNINQRITTFQIDHSWTQSPGNINQLLNISYISVTFRLNTSFISVTRQLHTSYIPVTNSPHAHYIIDFSTQKTRVVLLSKLQTEQPMLYKQIKNAIKL